MKWFSITLKLLVLVRGRANYKAVIHVRKVLLLQYLRIARSQLIRQATLKHHLIPPRLLLPMRPVPHSKLFLLFHKSNCISVLIWGMRQVLLACRTKSLVYNVRYDYALTRRFLWRLPHQLHWISLLQNLSGMDFLFRQIFCRFVDRNVLGSCYRRSFGRHW